MHVILLFYICLLIICFLKSTLFYDNVTLNDILKNVSSGNNIYIYIIYHAIVYCLVGLYNTDGFLYREYYKIFFTYAIIQIHN